MRTASLEPRSWRIAGRVRALAGDLLDLFRFGATIAAVTAGLYRCHDDAIACGILAWLRFLVADRTETQAVHLPSFAHF